MVFGYVFAVLAAVASGSGSVLESLGVRRAGVFGGTSSQLVLLVRQPLYFLGLGVDLLGFVFAAVALRQLPLFLVQSVLAFSVGVTATISAIMGTRLAAAGWLSLGVGAVGLVLLGWSADPSEARPLALGWRWLLLFGASVPAAAIVAYTRRRGGRWVGPLLALGAGLSYCTVGVAARTFDPPGLTAAVLLDPTLWAMILNGVVAATLFAMALQRGRPTPVTAVMFTTNTALASLIGLALLNDQIRPGHTLTAAIGITTAIAGAIATAHYTHTPDLHEALKTQETPTS